MTDKTFTINFIDKNNIKQKVDAPVGLSILEIAHRHNKTMNSNQIDLEGACGGSLACCTCHVIVDPENFNALIPASDDEEDMLDLAFGLTKTSRLGCQIIMKPEFDNFTFIIPAATRNILID